MPQPPAQGAAPKMKHPSTACAALGCMREKHTGTSLFSQPYVLPAGRGCWVCAGCEETGRSLFFPLRQHICVTDVMCLPQVFRALTDQLAPFLFMALGPTYDPQ